MVTESFFTVLACLFGPIGFYVFFTEFYENFSLLTKFIFYFISFSLVILYRFAKKKLFMESIEQLKIKDDTVNDFLDKTR